MKLLIPNLILLCAILVILQQHYSSVDAGGNPGKKRVQADPPSGTDVREKNF
jgi:hypothetical protein